MRSELTKFLNIRGAALLSQDMWDTLSDRVSLVMQQRVIYRTLPNSVIAVYLKNDNARI